MVGNQIPELPEGPVTVMFTDVVGSTALRTSLGDGEADKLFRQHGEVVEAEIEAHRGHNLQAALGDGFLAVFVSTRRALACAVSIQQAIERFNADRAAAPLKIRIGLNTGEITWQGGQPSGEAIHAASRVCGAADGGEVFVSDVTRQLAGTIPDVTFTDRGEHDLKGFPSPWKLWSLTWRSASPETPQAVFVGREHEVAELRKHLTAALDGRGGIVLLGGEPGVGKTTLTKQLIREAEARGALALFGRCYESEGAVPYSPFVEIFEQALRAVPPEWLREDMGSDAEEIARMVPELRRRFPDIGEPLDLPPEQQRRYFFNAVAAFISRAAERLPVVLIMDDVHWADEPTLLLIEHVADRLKEMRVLGVGTYRDVELDVSRPLAASLERLLRARAADRISVQRFDKAGVSRMLAAMAGSDPPPALVDAIYSETEGNPFFVEEVFRHFVEEGKVFDESGSFRTDIEVDEFDVPESVRLVVGRRLERLGPDAKKALAAGAVVGRGFSFRLLETISDILPDTLLDVIDEAESARVIVPEEREGDVHYTFAHELIRQTLLSSLSIPRRQRLHLAVADAIERLDPMASETRPSEVATHLLEAGVAADAKRTIDYLTKAVDRALEAAAFEDAARFVESALDLMDPDAGPERLQLLENLGRAQRAMGRTEEALTTLRAVFESHRDAGELEDAARVNFDVGYILTAYSRYPEAIANGQEALDMLGDREVPDRAMILGGVGGILSFAGFEEMAQDYLVQAESFVDQFGPAVRGRVVWTRTVFNVAFGRHQEGLVSGLSAVDLLREGNDQWTLADALGWLSLNLVSVGSYEEAIRLGSEGAELAKRTGHMLAQFISERSVAFGRGALYGDLDELEAAALHDLEHQQAMDSVFEAQSYIWHGVIVQLRGRLEEAAIHFEKAAATEPPSAFSGSSWGFRALNHAISGNPTECRAVLSERRAELPEPGGLTTYGKNTMLFTAAEAAAIAGLEAESADLFPLARRRLEPFSARFWDGSFPARFAAMAAATLGLWDDAEEYFELALAQLVHHPNVIEAPQIRHWYAKMLLDRGRAEDRERTREMVGSALDDYRRIGMPVLADMAEELLK